MLTPAFDRYNRVRRELTLYFRPVRALLLFGLCFCATLCSAQASSSRESADRILINEVLPGNQGVTTDSTGRTPDWIELYNPASRAVDLIGWRIAMAGRQHVFTGSFKVAAKSYGVLWCDGRSNEGSDHIAFKLAREGGALLLIAPDGTTIADVFSYPAIPGNVSIGRLPDGAKAWSFFAAPTPGSRNPSDQVFIRERCTAPMASYATGHYADPLMVELNGGSGCTIRYTLDGSVPTSAHGSTYTTPLRMEANTPLRAQAFAADKLASDPFCATYLIGGGPDQALAITLAPEDLWNDTTGIYTTGAFNNNTRSGKAWERAGVAQWSGDSLPIAVDVRISGSGSRSARKRSFKLMAREGELLFADSTRTNEGLLRADAGPHAFLRNTTMEELVRRFALHVETQPSVAVALYLNAQPWGLYRWMPAKDGEWLKQRCGAEALDVLEGPAAVALSGSNDHFLRAQELLMRGAPIDSIDAMIDARSLIDLACFDLWTGRADHDLNVRCYRPRQQGGRWRWVLFDMDLWAPANEGTVERMCSAAAPETPYIPQLIGQQVLQGRLLARITAMQAAVFSRVAFVADSIHHAHQDELLADFRRWELELDMHHPDSTLAQMQAFAAARPDQLFAQLARRTGRKLRTVTIEGPLAAQGQLFIDGLLLAPGRQDVRCFSGVDVRFEARAAEGGEFAGWKGADAKEAEISIDLSRTRNLRAVFRAVLP